VLRTDKGQRMIVFERKRMRVGTRALERVLVPCGRGLSATHR
jgi:hypothetical protein